MWQCETTQSRNGSGSFGRSIALDSAGAGAGTDTDTDAGTDTGTGAGTGTGTGTDADTGTDPDADPDAIASRGAEFTTASPGISGAPARAGSHAAAKMAIPSAVSDGGSAARIRRARDRIGPLYHAQPSNRPRQTVTSAANSA